MIIGRDLMSQLGIILDFDGQTMTWEESTVKMKDYEELLDILLPVNEFYWHEEIYESQALNDASSRLKKIVPISFRNVCTNSLQILNTYVRTLTIY